MIGTSTATLILVATLVAGQGTGLEVDAGLANGLRVGDRGQVYYELKVGQEARRVDVGEVRVVELDDFSATVEHEGERRARAGYRVRFELPGGRISPSELIRLAAGRLDEAQFDQLVTRVIEDLVPVDPAIESRIQSVLDRRGNGRKPVLPEQAAVPVQDVPSRAKVAAGVFVIGLPVEKATYFNQQPQFELQLEAFEIDRKPVNQSEFQAVSPGHVFDRESPELPATAIAFDSAQRYCRDRGGRVPTEFEWEVGIRETGFDTVEGLLEWTSSWLEAYPGNTRPEADYGERFKVLRTAAWPGDPDLFVRRFLDPAKMHASVGFRCAYVMGAAN